VETSTSLLEELRRSPDEQAWRRFDDLYRPWIRRWLQRDPALGEDSEDLVQEILSVVYRELPGFERERTGSFRKWLRTIAVHRLQGYRRKQRSQPRGQGGVTNESFLNQLADDSSELARRWDQEHDEHVVGQLLRLAAGEFNDVDVRAFRQVVLDSVRPAEAAEELGVTVNVVLLAKSRILQRLRVLGKGLLE
jgi:RNA polymerase sigma-70 factor (ECF subfamily)